MTPGTAVNRRHLEQELAREMARADQALYRAKDGGRNRIELAENGLY